jgi:hypothetical protein
VTPGAGAEAIVLGGSSIFWSQGLGGIAGVYEFALPDGGPSTLDSSYSFDVASNGAAVYAALYSSGSIGTRSLSAAAGTPLTAFVTGENHPFGIAATSNGVYWTTVDPSNGAGEVRAADLDGSNVRTLVPNLGALSYLTASATNVYYVYNGGVSQVPFDGGAASEIFAGVAGDYVNDIVLDGQTLYFDTLGTVSGAPTPGSIWEFPLDGTQAVRIASDQLTPLGLTTDANNVYWVNEGSSYANGGPADGALSQVNK